MSVWCILYFGLRVTDLVFVVFHIEVNNEEEREGERALEVLLHFEKVPPPPMCIHWNSIELRVNVPFFFCALYVFLMKNINCAEEKNE
mmetsp:Transcript_238/g.296  ORF Transcript_238/g.296 Transcript_238/m.296 type:complete len:88 (+) Transcript_238:1232-1495(+)